METLAAGPLRRFDAGGPSLVEVGETEILRGLTEIARAVSGAAHLLVATGDDGCVWRPPTGRDVVVSQDALVEGQDFRRAWLSPEELGARALHVALSDLAGMGAMPMLCLATLCAAGTTQADDVLAIQRGLCAAAASVDCRVAGGDVSATEGPLILDVVVIGTVARGRALRRDAGRPGDVLVVTGHLGRAAAGLQLLLGALNAPEAVADLWRRAQVQPRARVAEGIALAERGVRCANDLSDGLVVDLARTLEASGCGAEIWLDHIPADPQLRELLGARWEEVVLGGGEDFELLAAVPLSQLTSLERHWPEGLATLRVIGRLDAGPGLRLRAGPAGEPVEAPRVLSRHFGT